MTSSDHGVVVVSRGPAVKSWATPLSSRTPTDTCGPPPRLSNELGPDVEGLGCARKLVGLHRAMPVPAIMLSA